MSRRGMLRGGGGGWGRRGMCILKSHYSRLAQTIKYFLIALKLLCCCCCCPRLTSTWTTAPNNCTFNEYYTIYIFVCIYIIYTPYICSCNIHICTLICWCALPLCLHSFAWANKHVFDCRIQYKCISIAHTHTHTRVSIKCVCVYLQLYCIYRREVY